MNRWRPREPPDDDLSTADRSVNLIEPQLVPAERWARDLSFLREIPFNERDRYRLAPPSMNYATANRWARRIGADKVIPLSSGETLVRLPETKPSPWELPD